MNDRDVSAVPAREAPLDHGPTAGEELVHAATHGLGAVFSLAVLVTLVAFALANGSIQNVVSAAVFGAIALLGRRHGRPEVCAVALLLIAGMCAGRMLDTSHTLSDVLAGLCLGGGWLLVCDAVVSPRGRSRP